MHTASAGVSLALLGLASAAPAGGYGANVPSINSLLSGSFVVNNVPTGNNVTRNGPAAMNAALSKYGFSTGAVDTTQGDAVSGSAGTLANPAVEVANKLVGGSGASSGTGSNAANSETGEVNAASINNDVEYVSQIQVGGQTIAVNFDTGSSDLWLFNTKMDSSLTTGHTLYDPSKSRTWQQMQGQSFSVSYGDTSKAAGNIVGTDVVNVGGADFEKQVIELATQVTPSFVKDTNSNGLVGLAFSKLNTVRPTQAKTFIDNVATQLKEPVFTANLKHDATGSYEFGNIDTTAFQGSMVWVPVDTENGFWQFSSQTYSIGGGTAQVQTNPIASPAIADTGTSLLLMDWPVVRDYYSQVQGADNTTIPGSWSFPCNANLPDLNIGILGGAGKGGKMNNIPGNLINYAQDAGRCFGGLQWNQGGKLQILGDVLFKSAFVAFNMGNSSLGFATHAN